MADFNYLIKNYNVLNFLKYYAHAMFTKDNYTVQNRLVPMGRYEDKMIDN